MSWPTHTSCWMWSIQYYSIIYNMINTVITTSSSQPAISWWLVFFIFYSQSGKAWCTPIRPLAVLEARMMHVTCGPAAGYAACCSSYCWWASREQSTLAALQSNLDSLLQHGDPDARGPRPIQNVRRNRPYTSLFNIFFTVELSSRAESPYWLWMFFSYELGDYSSVDPLAKKSSHIIIYSRLRL
jgi:hypothetical protein